MIVLKEVTKTFGKKTVLDHVSLTINPGEFVCVVGKSGAGKTTLLQLLIGAERATEGGIEVDGVDLRAIPPPVLQLYRRRVGFIFQDYRLIPHRTVRENCAFPLEACGWSDGAIRERVTDVLQILGLSALEASLPLDLSGGEQARVAIARAVIHEPMFLLADEPTGNLDPQQSMEILRLFQQIHQAGTTVILATHDSGLVSALQTRVVYLKDGKIVQDAKGGYPDSAQSEPARHEILAKEPVTISSGDDAPEKRKIKITAIHS
ncbi:MAG: ATP-binding cassette domain-containing protein [Candidatus Peribacter sp.]|nr:ATP-binding cassette domain-containing protein [Candidatus Peribacter sp.]